MKIEIAETLGSELTRKLETVLESKFAQFFDKKNEEEENKHFGKENH